MVEIPDSLHLVFEATASTPVPDHRSRRRFVT